MTTTTQLIGGSEYNSQAQKEYSDIVEKKGVKMGYADLALKSGDARGQSEFSSYGTGNVAINYANNYTALIALVAIIGAIYAYKSFFKKRVKNGTFRRIIKK